MSKLDIISIIHQDIEKLPETEERNFSRCFIFLSIYGAFEKDIEDIFLKSLKSDNAISNSFFEKEQFHRGLEYKDLKDILTKFFKKSINENKRDEYKNGGLLEPNEIAKYDEYIKLRHNIAHQNNNIPQMSKEQNEEFLQLAKKFRDNIETYIEKVIKYHAYELKIMTDCQ
jgi:hypothetical protein